MSDLYEAMKQAMIKVGRDKLIVNLEMAIIALSDAGYKMETESVYYRKDLIDYQIDKIEIEKPDGTSDTVVVSDTELKGE